MLTAFGFAIFMGICPLQSKAEEGRTDHSSESLDFAEKSYQKYLSIVDEPPLMALQGLECYRLLVTPSFHSPHAIYRICFFDDDRIEYRYVLYGNRERSGLWKNNGQFLERLVFFKITEELFLRSSGRRLTK